MLGFSRARLASPMIALAALAIVPVALPPSRAAAQQAAPTDAQRARARELYGAGQSHFEAGRFAEAQEAFEGAYREVPNPVVLLGVASAQERLGHPLDAARTLRRYLRERADAPDRATIEGRIAQLDPRGETASETTEAAAGTVRVTCTPVGAAIAVDGVDTGQTAPAELTLPAGEHTIALTFEGYSPVVDTITVAPGGTHELTLTLVESGGAEPQQDVLGQDGAEAAIEDAGTETAAPVAPPVDSGPSAAVWVTTAIAGVGLVTGTVFGFLALSAQSDFDAMPNETDAERGETFALIADLAFGVALASGVTAIVLYAVDRPQSSETSQASAHEEGPRVSFAPWATPTGAGAAARVQF